MKFFLEVFVVMHVVLFQEAKSCVNLKVVLKVFLDEESFDFLVMIKRKLPLDISFFKFNGQSIKLLRRFSASWYLVFQNKHDIKCC